MPGAHPHCPRLCCSNKSLAEGLNSLYVQEREKLQGTHLGRRPAKQAMLLAAPVPAIRAGKELLARRL